MKKLWLAALLLFPTIALAEVRATDARLADRMDRYSQRLMGQPYLGGALGEGSGGKFDRDPRFREDAFDCTTFVETVIAVAKAKTKASIMTNMDKIRYKSGVVSFETRNHMPGIDWIRNNKVNGTLVDITQSIDSDSTYMAEALIQKDEWFRKLGEGSLAGIPDEEKAEKLEQLRALSKKFGKSIEKVPFLYKYKIVENPEILNRIPHGSIINIVRPKWNLVEVAGTQLNISHQGFAFHRDGVVYFRHAKLNDKVTEEPLLDYVKRTIESPTIQGINVLSIR